MVTEKKEIELSDRDLEQVSGGNEVEGKVPCDFYYSPGSIKCPSSCPHPDIKSGTSTTVYCPCYKSSSDED